MSIKTLKLPLFSLIVGLMIAGVTWQAVKAQEQKKTNCNSKLLSGTTYKTRLQGSFQQAQTLGISGGLNIIRTYQCTRGTCFRASMKIDNYETNVDKVEGYWQGSTIQFTRYVGQENTPEAWSGQCLESSVTGKWYFPNSPDNKHLFTIAY